MEMREIDLAGPALLFCPRSVALDRPRHPATRRLLCTTAAVCESVLLRTSTEVKRMTWCHVGLLVIRFGLGDNSIRCFFPAGIHGWQHEITRLQVVVESTLSAMRPPFVCWNGLDGQTGQWTVAKRGKPCSRANGQAIGQAKKRC